MRDVHKGKTGKWAQRIASLVLGMALGIMVTAAYADADAAPRYGAYPRHATVINAGDYGPSFRFYQEASNNTIAYDYSYNDGATWQYGGNLGGATLLPGESVAATFLADRVIVLITNTSNGVRYYKQSQIDAYGVSVAGFGSNWTPLLP